MKRRKPVVTTKKSSKKDTQRQQKLVKILSVNIGTENSHKTMYDMMIEAGYAETTARQQSGVLAGIKERREVKDIVTRLEGIVQNAVKALEEKDFSKIDATAIARIVKDMNHDIELLSGRPTERDDGELSLNPEDREMLDKILDANKK